MLDINNENKIDELLNLVKELKESKCKNCKEKTIDPFSWEYFRKYLFTKKYLVNTIWKTIVKTLVIALLVIFFYDKWFALVDYLRTKLPWNDLGRRYPKVGKKIEEIYKEFEVFN